MSSARSALSLAALLILAACGTDSTTPASTAGSPTTIASESTTVPDAAETSTTAPVSTADFLVGGEFADNTYAPLFLNALECPVGTHTQTFGFGSTTFEVLGIQGEQCAFNHGTEIEDPDWNGAMTHACLIDLQETIELTVTDEGINLDSFQDFCVEV